MKNIKIITINIKRDICLFQEIRVGKQMREMKKKQNIPTHELVRTSVYVCMYVCSRHIYRERKKKIDEEKRLPIPGLKLILSFRR